MGRKPASSTSSQVTDGGLRKGAWTVEEDSRLMAYVTKYGCWNWRQLPNFAGLARCGKSCRLRWLNYLSPNIKRGNYSNEEEETIVRMHETIGKKWSLIAAALPGRTDNEIKNHWHGKLKKTLAKKIPSFKNRIDANEYSLVNEESNCEAVDANNLLTDKLISNNKKDYDQCGASSSSEDIFSNLNGDFWKDPFVVDSDYTNNYVDLDDDYFQQAESLVAATNYGYESMLSLSSLPDGPPDYEDSFLLPLWYE